MFPFPSTLLIATGTIGSAPTYVASSDNATTGNSSLTVSYPAGIQSGASSALMSPWNCDMRIAPILTRYE